MRLQPEEIERLWQESRCGSWRGYVREAGDAKISQRKRINNVRATTEYTLTGQLVHRHSCAACTRARVRPAHQERHRACRNQVYDMVYGLRHLATISYHKMLRGLLRHKFPELHKYKTNAQSSKYPRCMISAADILLVRNTISTHAGVQCRLYRCRVLRIHWLIPSCRYRDL